MRVLLLGIVLCLATPAVAEEMFAGSDAVNDSATSDVRQHDAEPDTHPVLSSDATWSGSMIIAIVGMFLAAAAIGPLVRAELGEEAPPIAGHDEHVAHHH